MMQEFVQEVKDMAQSNVNEIHTAIPGSIMEFDPATGQATVSPSMKYNKPDGEKIDYPNVSGVPVYFPQSASQQATIAYPVKPGDGCLLIVSEQALDYWMYGMETTSDLRFDLTNCIALVGLFAKANSVVAEACDQDAIIIDVKGTRITVKDKLVQVDAETVTINATDTIVNGNFTVNGGVVNLN